MTNLNLKNLSIEQIDRVYSGTPGCACGCRGNYSTSDRSKKILLKKLAAANPNSIQYDDEFIFWDNETGTRTYTIYFKK